MTEKEPLTSLKGVGQKRAKLFESMGITDIGSLLGFFPRDYTDYTAPVPINELNPEDNAVFRGKVTKKLRPYITPKVAVYRLAVSDDTDTMLITIFNSIYVYNSLTEGREYLFSGKIKGTVLAKECASPSFIEINSMNRLAPKYKLTEGLTMNAVTACIKQALEECDIKSSLPSHIMEKYGLLERKEALFAVHFPKDHETLEQGRRTLAFEELLTLRLGMLLIKKREKRRVCSPMNAADMDLFFGRLLFRPTGAQLRAINECISDMKREVPMNRLLQGDVGSGKTLVAAALCFFAAKNGSQSALMAPTEILARQHYDTLSSMLTPFGINVVLLTANSDKKAAKSALSEGTASVAVGTHALIQSDVEFKALGLVITDEQHRFGVRQRSFLSEKAFAPHTLVMSATPIPRTLAFSIYGDLDISVLDEMPAGRLPVKTYGVTSAYRERIYKFIIKYINNGFSAYIVCPLIEKSEASDEKTAAADYYEALKGTWFRDIPIGLLHGKMKQAEKEAVMEDFRGGRLKLLVATTVIEVGVDVPDAVIMVIENAERFGLSQLHQLRGRVGRGKEQSHCILITDSDSEYTKARIDIMVKTTDGFEIANEDLRLRGPGSFFGARQHGLPELKIADMSSDIRLINETSRLADEILCDDPKLDRPENAGLKRLVRELFRESEAYGIN